MRQLGLRSLRPGPHSCARPARGVAPVSNRLVGQLADTPDAAWGSDLTQLPVGNGLMHLVVLLDLHSRHVVGWRLSNTQRAELCCDALDDALRQHGPPRLLHSDKGAQYGARRVRARLLAHRIVQSMTGPAGWRDNAVVESWFATLKGECTRLHAFEHADAARRVIARYVHHYNHRRPHSSLGNRTPAQVYRAGRGENNRDAPRPPGFQLAPLQSDSAVQPC